MHVTQRNVNDIIVKFARFQTLWYIYTVKLVVLIGKLLPPRASEQGNVIGLVSVYLSSKKNCN